MGSLCSKESDPELVPVQPQPNTSINSQTSPVQSQPVKSETVKPATTPSDVKTSGPPEVIKSESIESEVKKVEPEQHEAKIADQDQSENKIIERTEPESVELHAVSSEVTPVASPVQSEDIAQSIE